MARLLRGLSLCAMVPLLCGCVISRQITDVAAHGSYNNYKIQTVSTRFALITAWVTWEGWSCQKVNGVFQCTEVDYERTKAGFTSMTPASRPAAQQPHDRPAPAAPQPAPMAPQPAQMAPPTHGPPDAPAPAPTAPPAGGVQ